MPVLPPLKPFFDAMLASGNHSDPRPPAEARVSMHAMIDASFVAFVAPQEPMPHEMDHEIAVPGDTITVRVYSPTKAETLLPCHLHFHGGGFWLGTLEQSDAGCRALARAADCVVVSVDYRLAPEHKFPAAPEDCYAALLWVVENAAVLGVDTSRISVGGGSAGGNLAAAICLMTRDRGGPALVQQILEIPVTDFTVFEPLRIPLEDLVIPSGKDQYGGYYLASAADATNPYASPLLAHDLSGLPPALVMCAEYDPLMPEGAAYAKRLEAAGVPVEYHCWQGQFHGSQQMSVLIPDEVAAYQNLIVNTLRRAYGR